LLINNLLEKRVEIKNEIAEKTESDFKDIKI